MSTVHARCTHVAEVPFDSDYKFMATFHNIRNEQDKPVVALFRQGRAGCADRTDWLVLVAGGAR